jgi:hypothetical protein
MITRENDDLPLAFATPDGTDSAAIKRKASVDKWVESNAYRNVYDPVTQRHVREKMSLPKPVVLKNEAVAGFRLLDDIHRGGGWGAGTVKWRVEDPRGFELEITSPNLMQIISCSVIDGAEVLDKCIWAREGKENILVPVSSEVYVTAMENTARLAKSASMRDIEIGNTAVLSNGIRARYFGRLFEVERDYNKCGYRDELSKPFALKLVARHVFIDDTNKVHTYSSPKLSEIIPGGEMEKATAQKEINKLVGQGSFGYTFDKVLPTITRAAAETTWDDRGSSSLVFEVNGVLYRRNNAHYYGNNDQIEGEMINRDHWENGRFIISNDFRYRDGYGGYGYGFRHQQSGEHSFFAADLKIRGVKCYHLVSYLTYTNGDVKTIKH